MPVVVRRVREILVAGTTLSIAAAAHLLAGGALPTTALGWTVVLALTAPLAVWTSRRRLTLLRLLPAMTALQLVQHTALSFMAAGTSGALSSAPSSAPSSALASPASAPPVAHAGHGLHELGPGALSPAGAANHLHGDDPRTAAWMLAAHAAAVVVTALLLAAGDRAAASVVAQLRHVALLVRGAPALPVLPRRAGVVAGRPWRPHAWHPAGRPRLRAPPLPGALARLA